jgi:hypothetical protein
MNKWKSFELFPFSEGRRALAMSLGVRMFSPTATDEQKAAGVVMDTLMLLYLVCHSHEKLAHGHRNPDNLWMSAMTWAETNFTMEDYQDGVNLVSGILREAFAPRVKIRMEGQGDDLLGES